MLANPTIVFRRRSSSRLARVSVVYLSIFHYHLMAVPCMLYEFLLRKLKLVILLEARKLFILF